MTSSEKSSLRCIIIGAGVSGILMACKIKDHLEGVDVQILEKNSDVGGTWFENRYPGCACDVPSHVYQYSFIPSPYWSNYYATSPEIQSYLKAVVNHYELSGNIMFSTRVDKAEWQPATSTWKVNSSSDGKSHTMECDILINAGGILNNLMTPKFKNDHLFGGEKVHSAAWDPKVQVQGKKIAIIGAAASAVQILPAIQSEALSVDVYIRTPSWISPPTGALDHPATYTTSDMERYRDDPVYWLHMRQNMEAVYNKMFRAFFKSSNEQAEIRHVFEKRMRELIQDEALQEKLVPKFEVGCRRINPGEQYLVALQRENVTPVFDPIEAITEHGIIAADAERQADLIIYATGFDTSFRPRFPIIGVDGTDLRSLWEHDPISYFGTGVSGFPNYLTFLGPNTPISNGSAMAALEATGDYFVRLIKKMQRQGASSFDVKHEAQTDFDKHTQMFMKDMVWTGSCRSWFKRQSDSKVTALWPGSTLHYIETLEQNRWEDYDWQYRTNRFSYWKDGSSTADRVGKVDADFSHYLKEHAPLPLEAYERKETIGATESGADLATEEAEQVMKRLVEVTGFSV